MTHQFDCRSLRVAILGSTLLAGCGGRPVAPTPEAALARSSLEAALDAWKSGEVPGLIEGFTPPLTASDSRWEKGRRLSSYQVLQEEPSQGDRRFTVRLSLEKPPETEKARFVVLGNDPVWVFREEDYARQVNMDDFPKAAPKRRRR